MSAVALQGRRARPIEEGDMDKPRIYAADEHAVRLAAAVLREIAAATPGRRPMVRPGAPGAVRRARQAVPRAPVRRRRG